MSKLQAGVLMACVAALAFACGSTTAWAADDPVIRVDVSVDAGQTLRTMDPRRLGSTNVAMWYFPATYFAPNVQRLMADLHPRYVRIPGGSWANGVYWNGHGVRGADGKVDPGKVGPDGYPAVDYSDYAPSFLVDTKTLHPASNGWHGHVDVKTQHEFIKAFPGTEAMACPNAGTGRAVDAAEWVKWANQKMGYNVRVWEIGNELGGDWEAGTEMPLGKGRLTPEIYTARYNEMAKAMRQMDRTIKIGSCPFVEEALRDCGDNVDFVSVHAYPGSTTLSEAQMFADISKMVESQVTPIRKWIRQYQPGREKQIEIAYTEWNLAGGLDNARLFSGLWSSIFLGEIARNGVSMANQWDAFSDLFSDEEDGYAAKPEYYSLWLWNNYMGDRLIPTTSSHRAIYTYASRSDDAVSLMLINTDPQTQAQVDVRVSGFAPAAQGESATVTSREYYYNPVTRRVQWSTGARVEPQKTGPAFAVTLAPFSMTCVRIPSQAKPALSPMAQKAMGIRPDAQDAPELRFVLLAEAYAGDEVSGDLIVLSSGSQEPYRGKLGAATLSAGRQLIFDRSEVRLAEPVGHFSMRPLAPGEVTLTARSGDVKTTHKLTVKPSIPRPIVLWDFTAPPITDKEAFTSDFTLLEDLTRRANRAVARVDLPPAGAEPSGKPRCLLKINHLPDGDRLRKENIRGVTFDVMTSGDFACEDPEAGITVIMQSTANWWMPLGDIPLRDAKDWKTSHVHVTSEDQIKAMPAALNIMFILKANKPAKGSIYLDRVGFMVR